MSLYTYENNLRVEVSDSTSDSTVSVFSGGVRVGNVFASYPGGQRTLEEMTNFGGNTDVYQYSTLFLQAVNGALDLTSVVSVPETQITSLDFPELPSDSSSSYSPVHPLGLFTIYSDGTVFDLISYKTE